MNILGSFTFNFGDRRTYSLPWNAYFHDDTDSLICRMSIVAGATSNVIIGNAFMRHFYTLYDVTWKTVSIALASYTFGSVTSS
jgi:hypothetical protein